MVRPEDHLGPEQEKFSQAYVQYLRKTLKFYPRVQTRVNLALKKVAKEMNKKPKDITYIGIHNRRTDHLEFMRETMKMKDLEELGKDFFMDGMEYFRYVLLDKKIKFSKNFFIFKLIEPGPL